MYLVSLEWGWKGQDPCDWDKQKSYRKLWKNPKNPRSIWTYKFGNKKNRHCQLQAMQPLIASYGNVQVLNHLQQGCPTAPSGQNPALWSLPSSQWSSPLSRSEQTMGTGNVLSADEICIADPVPLPPPSTRVHWKAEKRVPPSFPEVKHGISPNAWWAMCHGQAVGRRCLNYLCGTSSDINCHDPAVGFTVGHTQWIHRYPLSLLFPETTAAFQRIAHKLWFNGFS